MKILFMLVVGIGLVRKVFSLLVFSCLLYSGVLIVL